MQEAIGWFERFGLAGFEHHYPATLSGGMRQRASLLRTFLTGREILVLDEPFGALDALTRMRMQEWLLGIHDEFHKTIVLVTHDVDEALYLSDRVYVMTSRPGTMGGSFDVSLSRPRRYEQTVTSPAFTALKRSLLQNLTQTVRGGRCDGLWSRRAARAHSLGTVRVGLSRISRSCGRCSRSYATFRAISCPGRSISGAPAWTNMSSC